jgi:hypothetical protein
MKVLNINSGNIQTYRCMPILWIGICTAIQTTKGRLIVAIDIQVGPERI